MWSLLKYDTTNEYLNQWWQESARLFCINIRWYVVKISLQFFKWQLLNSPDIPPRWYHNAKWFAKIWDGLTFIPRNMYTVYWCSISLGLCHRFEKVNVAHLPVFARVVSLPLGKSCDCHGASEVTLSGMGKIYQYQSTRKQKSVNRVHILECVLCMKYSGLILQGYEYIEDDARTEVANCSCPHPSVNFIFIRYRETINDALKTIFTSRLRPCFTRSVHIMMMTSQSFAQGIVGSGNCYTGSWKVISNG